MSTLPVNSPALFSALFDDAAMFPPGNATPGRALRCHQRLKAGSHSSYIGPLLVSQSRWGAFLSAYGECGSPEIDVKVLGAERVVSESPTSLHVLGYEVMALGGGLPQSDRTLPVAVEIQDASVRADVLRALGEARAAGSPWIAKFRTGGTTADAFPDECELAGIIQSTVAAGVPFKLTAGLHDPVRHTDGRTGFEHHGFLNVLTGVKRCVAGADEETLASVLADRDGDALVAEVLTWTAHEVDSVRSVFRSVGCCGVDEPLAAAVRLGLIAAES